MSVLLCHGPNKAVLVPDSCRMNDKNGNSISADVIELTIENKNSQNCACFCYFQLKYTMALDFLTLQDKHNIHYL